MNERDAILDCLFIGGSTQDVMMRMERVPQADERVQAWDYVKCCGGVSATAAEQELLLLWEKMMRGPLSDRI